MVQGAALLEKDIFTDHEILVDPYAYFEEVRRHGPVFQPPGKDYLIVTGFSEALEIFRNTTDFSASIALQGAGAPLPFVPEGRDISEQLEAHRQQFLGHNLMVNMDGTAHTNLRALANRLFVPSRLKANEKFIASYSDELVRKATAKGQCELMSEVATPLVTLVIADILGVPAEDREFFIELLQNSRVPGNLNSEEAACDTGPHPLVVMGGYFAKYIRNRIDHPQDDIFSELAHAPYPDGTKPKLEEMVNLATLMFGAGQDTSAKLIGNAMRYIVDEPGLQDQLRADPSLIPLMLEEVLRLEGSSKITARLAIKDVVVGGVEIQAGQKIAIAVAAISRDDRRWNEPHSFLIDRPRIKEHLSFGRGAHTCPGAPLARAEVCVLFEKFMKYAACIELDETRHGSRGARNLNFEPSFIVRGLTELHVNLSPAT